MWPFTSRKVPEQTREVPMAGRSGFGAPYGIHYTERPQPNPGGARVYSYDTEALPLYTPIGPGVQNRRQFLSYPSNQVVWQNQAIALTTVGNPGNLAGTLGGSGLIDVSGDGSGVPFPIPGSFEIPVRQ